MTLKTPEERELWSSVYTAMACSWTTYAGWHSIAAKKEADAAVEALRERLSNGGDA